jgi:flagellar hook-length control protein FliK
VPAHPEAANAPAPDEETEPKPDIIAATPIQGPPEAAPAPQPMEPQPTDPKPAANDAEPATLHEPVATADVATPPTVLSTPAPTLPTTAVPTQAATATTPTPPHAATPVEQITPALVSLGHAPDGAQRLTMRLQPPELGQVQIRIDRPTLDAPARVAITVERPETLTLLLRDQPQLQRALDQAGVPAEGRSVTFHVATPEPSTRTDTATAPQPAGWTSSMGGDLSHGASRQGGMSMQGDTAATEDSEEIEAIPGAPVSWQRAGLDITA